MNLLNEIAILTVESVWASIVPVIKTEIGESQFHSYLAQAKIMSVGTDTVLLVTSTVYARDWLRKNVSHRLRELWQQADTSGRLISIVSKFETSEACVTEPFPVPEAKAIEKGEAASESTPAVSGAHSSGGQKDKTTASRLSGLQPRLTFDSFVEGPANAFALETARKVAAFQCGPFNPIFFHGPYGQGKTHLINAIGWAASQARPDAKIVYLTAEKFTSTFVRAIMDKSTAAFKEEIRGAELLLIDDVHFIGGKVSSQEELFHTLTTLIENRVNVVFTADRPPAMLTEVEVRFRSYLSAGLVCGLEPADSELRLGIIEQKLLQLRSSLGFNDLPRAEIIHSLAEKIPGTIRELEGAVNTLAASAGQRLGSISLSEAMALLAPNLKVVSERRITVDEIQKNVADYYGLKQADLLSERRTRTLARPRQVAMWLCKKLTTRSYPDIGRRFGGRDHTTVLHAVKKIETLMSTDEQMTRDTEALTRRLRNG